MTTSSPSPALGDQQDAQGDKLDPRNQWYEFRIPDERDAIKVTNYLTISRWSYFVAYGIHGWSFVVKEEAVEPVKMLFDGFRIDADFTPFRGPMEAQL